MTFANGGDNIGVYVPVFASINHTAIAAYCVVFVILVGALVSIARYVATRRRIAEILERGKRAVSPGADHPRGHHPRLGRRIRPVGRVVGVAVRRHGSIASRGCG